MKTRTLIWILSLGLLVLVLMISLLFFGVCSNSGEEYSEDGFPQKTDDPGTEPRQTESPDHSPAIQDQEKEKDQENNKADLILPQDSETETGEENNSAQQIQDESGKEDISGSSMPELEETIQNPASAVPSPEEQKPSNQEKQDPADLNDTPKPTENIPSPTFNPPVPGEDETPILPPYGG